MKNTFFDSLMISDSERIHTQTLAWIISLNDSVFPIDKKKQFLSELFNISGEIGFEQSVYVETELNKIDLFIDTDNYQFLIENKLKSSEHSNQTFRYFDSIPSQFEAANKTRKFGFLTLVKDEPMNQEWIPISFEKLKDSLENVEWNESKRETVFIKEYIQTLGNLTGVYNEFIDNHRNYANVFTDGTKKKYEKERYKNELQDYIRRNQLETIFQKAYLKTVLKDANIEFIEIGETRGTALFQTLISEVNVDGEIFRLGFQFQGKAMKINLVHKNYADSKPEQVGERLIEIFKNVFHRQNNYNSFNKPRKKAYISVSKTLTNEIFNIDKDALIKLLKTEIEYSSNKVNELENEINTAYNK
ncbi:MAG TPA: PD-(D/E)XK nuclease family protein [Bacteroidales bacterium]|nr:PD-(D/E)XK nuclease family protein [Bacteroidales bacterium]